MHIDPTIGRYLFASALAALLLPGSATPAPAGQDTTGKGGAQVARTVKDKPGAAGPVGSPKAAEAPRAKKSGAGRPLMLVPPPPPTIPASTMLTFMSPLPLELLSESDLKKQKEETAARLERARQAARQQDEGFRERKGRSDLFQNLYKEGVVSRRELEGVARETAQAEIDLTDARLKVTDLERDMKKIDERLAKFAADHAKPSKQKSPLRAKTAHK